MTAFLLVVQFRGYSLQVGSDRRFGQVPDYRKFLSLPATTPGECVCRDPEHAYAGMT
jgi:hypothetical protein